MKTTALEHQAVAALEAPPLTVAAAVVRNVLSAAMSQDSNWGAWFKAARLSPQCLASDDTRVSVQQFNELLRAAVAGCGDETLFMLERRSKPGTVLLQARCALGAPTLDIALSRIAHVFGLLHDDVELAIVRSGQRFGIALRFHLARTERNPHAHELLLRSYWRLGAWLVGGQLQPVGFDFAFPRPSYADHYGRVSTAPWRFDSAMSAVWFDQRSMQMPVCRDEVALDSFSKDIVTHILLPRRDHGMSGRVRSYLQCQQPGWPDLGMVANAFNMSTATLQRHLAVEGTSFKSLRDRLRREIAIHRLHTSRIPLARLAQQLGFSDSSSFQHAFKLWTGYPPGSYRRSGDRLD